MLDAVVDLSHHNDVRDWAELKSGGTLGVIHKASQGSTIVDAKYGPRRAPATAAGLWWGAYHFGVGGDGVAQANHFLDAAGPTTPTLLVLDFEVNPSGSSMTIAQAEAFITTVHDATGRWPGLYAGQSYLDGATKGAPSETLKQCWFWCAAYGPKAHVPKGWSTWTMWQYTDGSIGPDSRKTPGVNGGCDRSRFNGAADRLGLLFGAS